MVAKIQIVNKFVILFDVENNKVIKEVAFSGHPVIAETKIRVWAKNHEVVVK